MCADNKDAILEIDAFNLQAVCKYRLHLPLEAVACFNSAKRKQKRLNEKANLQTNLKLGVWQEYTDLFLRETHVDLTAQEERNLFQRRNSFD